MVIPDSLKWLGRHEAGTQWLNRLPLVLDELTKRWDLELRGEPFSSANVSYVVSVSGTSPRDGAMAPESALTVDRTTRVVREPRAGLQRTRRTRNSYP